MGPCIVAMDRDAIIYGVIAWASRRSPKPPNARLWKCTLYPDLSINSAVFVLRSHDDLPELGSREKRAIPWPAEMASAKRSAKQPRFKKKEAQTPVVNGMKKEEEELVWPSIYRFRNVMADSGIKVRRIKIWRMSWRCWWSDWRWESSFLGTKQQCWPVCDSGNWQHPVALRSLKTLIQMSPSSMTAVPKLLKFIRLHYPDLQKRYDEWPASPVKVPSQSLLFNAWEILCRRPLRSGSDLLRRQNPQLPQIPSLLPPPHRHRLEPRIRPPPCLRNRSRLQQTHRNVFPEPADDLLDLPKQLIPFLLLHRVASPSRDGSSWSGCWYGWKKRISPRPLGVFQTHMTPVLIGYGKRAEFVTEEYVPYASVLEGFIILKRNPEHMEEDK